MHESQQAIPWGALLKKASCDDRKQQNVFRCASCLAGPSEQKWICRPGSNVLARRGTFDEAISTETYAENGDDGVPMDGRPGGQPTRGGLKLMLLGLGLTGVNGPAGAC